MAIPFVPNPLESPRLVGVIPATVPLGGLGAGSLLGAGGGIGVGSLLGGGGIGIGGSLLGGIQPPIFASPASLGPLTFGISPQQFTDVMGGFAQLSSGWQALGGSSLSPLLGGLGGAGLAQALSVSQSLAQQFSALAGMQQMAGLEQQLGGLGSALGGAGLGGGFSAPAAAGGGGSAPPTVAVIDDFGSAHGSEVAGTIQAGGAQTLDMNINVPGQSRDAMIASNLSQVLQAVKSGQKIDAVNLSQQDFQGSPYSGQIAQTIQQLQAAGVPVVVAAGNSGPGAVNTLAQGAQYVVGDNTGSSGVGNVTANASTTSIAAAEVSAQVARQHSQG